MARVIGVSVGSDGAVWCVDSAGNAYMRVGSEWKKNPTAKAVEVAVGTVNNVWCRNSAGEIFKLKGSAHDGGWDKDAAANQVTSISVGGDGTLWVVNKQGQLARRDGNQWQHDPGVKDAVEVAVGNMSNVWYRNKAGRLLKLGANGKWQADATASQITSHAVGDDGTVWVVNQKGEFWTKFGNEWKKNDKGMGVQISAGRAGLVWCVNAAGEIFHAQAADWPTFWVKVAPPKDLPPSATYTIKQGDTLTGVLRAKYPTISTEELYKKSDQVAKLNGWPGTMADNYGGKATSLKAGDVIILEA